MGVLIYLSALYAACSALVLPRDNNTHGNIRELKGCPQPSEDFLSFSAQMSAQEWLDGGNGTAPEKREEMTIPTFVHVVALGKSVEKGWVSDDSIYKQIDVINEAFDKRDIHFKLKGITRMVHKDLGIIQEQESLEKLGHIMRKGDYATLNLYVVKSMPSEVAGACTLPKPYPDPDISGVGCRFNWDTLPPKSLGRVAIHEIGHWLGLLHTFQEAPHADPTCTTGYGDDIDDTPVHLSPNGWTECQPTNTCPGMEGEDPVDNYMNYTPTKCWKRFTDGQTKRMHRMLKVRRGATEEWEW